MKILLVLLGLFSLGLAQIPGGKSPLGVLDKKVLSIAGEFVTSYLGANGGTFDVLSATTQVVAGSLTTVNVRIHHHGTSEVCEVQVWEKVWENFKQTTSNCTQKGRRQFMAGGHMKQDPSKPEYAAMATEFMTDYLGLNGGQAMVTGVETQVVAGIITYMNVTVMNAGMVKYCSIKVYERAWEHFKDTHSNCTRHAKRAGGKTSQNPADPKFQVLAQEFKDQYLGASNGATFKVVSAQTQVVAGTNTYLSLELTHGGMTEQCDIVVWEKVWMNFKQVTSQHCMPKVKRQLVGGKTPQNPADAKFQALAQEFRDQYLGASNGATVKVVSAQTQVVAGVNTYLSLELTHGGMTEQCNIVVWEKSWMNFKQITSQHCIPKVKRQLILGGKMNHDVNDSKVQSLAQSFMTNYLGMNGGNVEVMSYQTQVVAGVNYFFTVKITSGPMVKVCAVTIYERSWENYSKTTSNCTQSGPAMASRRQLGMPGGIHSVSLTDPDLLGAVNFAVDQVNHQVNSMFRMSLTDVLSATQQVVAGMSYQITFKLGQSTCMNSGVNDGKSLTDCPVSTNGNALAMTCTATVWYKAWEKPQYTMTSQPNCA